MRLGPASLETDLLFGMLTDPVFEIAMHQLSYRYGLLFDRSIWNWTDQWVVDGYPVAGTRVA